MTRKIQNEERRRWYILLFDTKQSGMRSTRMKSGTAVSDNYQYIDLLEYEGTMDIMEAESISTVTIHTGTLPIDYLRERYNEIIGANPWLDGRLVKKSGKLQLRHDGKSSFNNFITLNNFRLPADKNLADAKTCIEEYSVALTPYLVKKGKMCVNKDEEVFRVIVGAVDSEQFFVCASLSHIIGDGYTFYQIYAMLSMDRSPYEMQAHRDAAGGRSIHQYNRDVHSLLHSPGIMCNILGNLMCGTKASVQVREINLDNVQHIKDSHVPTASPFLSTNDIVTSAYFNVSGCHIGVMAINYRNRVKGLTDNHAGNYEGAIVYQRGDFESPALIRQSLRGYHRCHKERRLIPGFCRRQRAIMCMVTNWSGFYHHLILPHTQHVVHLPIWETIHDPYAVTVCVIFMMAQNKPAVFSLEHHKRKVVDNMELILRLLRVDAGVPRNYYTFITL